MSIIISIPYRRRSRIKQKKPATRPAAVALTLVAASYDENVAVLTLTFDRAVDIAGLDPSAITVKDGALNQAIYPGTAEVTLINPTTFSIGLTVVDDYDSEETPLTATSATGIVAINDGGTWPGVT